MFKRLPLLAFAILCWVQTAAAQSNITGTVKDGAGVTLPGVSILEKGTTNGTLSDAGIDVGSWAYVSRNRYTSNH